MTDPTNQRIKTLTIRQDFTDKLLRVVCRRVTTHRSRFDDASKNGGFHPPYEIRDLPGEIRPCWPAQDGTKAARRRGIVLVLILGVLALMAVIGVTFATFSGQSRISARNFAQSVNQPQRDELMDYAL